MLKIQCREFQKESCPWEKHEYGKDAVEGFLKYANDSLNEKFNNKKQAQTYNVIVTD
jgi:hypothetical protein